MSGLRASVAQQDVAETMRTSHMRLLFVCFIKIWMSKDELVKVGRCAQLGKSQNPAAFSTVSNYSVSPNLATFFVASWFRCSGTELSNHLEPDSLRPRLRCLLSARFHDYIAHKAKDQARPGGICSPTQGRSTWADGCALCSATD